MSILDRDILFLLELDNYSIIILKKTSKFLSKIVEYKCNDCNKLVDKILYCSQCNRWFCTICNSTKYTSLHG